MDTNLNTIPTIDELTKAMSDALAKPMLEGERLTYIKRTLEALVLRSKESMPSDLVDAYALGAKEMTRQIIEMLKKMKAEEEKKYELHIHQIRRQDDQNELDLMRTERIAVSSTYSHVIRALEHSPSDEQGEKV